MQGRVIRSAVIQIAGLGAGLYAAVNELLEEEDWRGEALDEALAFYLSTFMDERQMALYGSDDSRDAVLLSHRPSKMILEQIGRSWIQLLNSLDAPAEMTAAFSAAQPADVAMQLGRALIGEEGRSDIRSVLVNASASASDPKPVFSHLIVLDYLSELLPLVGDLPESPDVEEWHAAVRGLGTAMGPYLHALAGVDPDSMTARVLRLLQASPPPVTPPTSQDVDEGTSGAEGDREAVREALRVLRFHTGSDRRTLEYARAMGVINSFERRYGPLQ